MEAALAPPAISAALDAGCHVLAEKPSCVRADDFAALVRKAEAKLKRLHRRVSRKQKRSKNRKKAIQRLAKGYLQVSRRRKDFAVKADSRAGEI